MNFAAIGRSEILFDTAGFLVANGHKLKLIVTSKEAPEYTKTAADFEALAKKAGAKFLFTSKINSAESVGLIRSIENLDIAVSVNCANIISNEVIALFPLGILNAHGGDLPRYRGNACQAWAIIAGEKRIALCIHKMAGGEIDSGDIITRDYLDIDLNTKIGDVWRWMTRTAPALFLNALEKLGNNPNFFLEKQSRDPADVMRCYPRAPEDGRIHWNRSNIEILRLINASSEPYPGAFCFLDGENVIIWDAALFEDNENLLAAPGQVASINEADGTVIVIAGDGGKLKIREIEFRGLRGKPAEVIKSTRKRFTS